MEIVKYNENVSFALSKPTEFPFYDANEDVEFRLVFGTLQKFLVIRKDNILYACSDLEDKEAFVIETSLIEVSKLNYPLKNKSIKIDVGIEPYFDIFSYQKIYQRTAMVCISAITDCDVLYHSGAFELQFAKYNPGTTRCVECGYDNEYMEPVQNYICTQCKMRNSSWR